MTVNAAVVPVYRQCDNEKLIITDRKLVTFDVTYDS